jgi:hypothetical protein
MAFILETPKPVTLLGRQVREVWGAQSNKINLL